MKIERKVIFEAKDIYTTKHLISVVDEIIEHDLLDDVQSIDLSSLVNELIHLEKYMELHKEDEVQTT